MQPQGEHANSTQAPLDVRMKAGLLELWEQSIRCTTVLSKLYIFFITVNVHLFLYKNTSRKLQSKLHFIRCSFCGISQMSSVPTLPCTYTRRFCSYLSLYRPVVDAWGHCLSTSKPLSAPQESTSSDRGTPCKQTTLCAQAPWKFWRTAWYWQFLVRSHNVWA